MKEEVYKYLDNLNISYQVVNHPKAYSTEDADKYIEGYEGIRTKTMFLYNKNKTNFYLIVMDENKRIDFKKLEEELQEKKLKFSSDEVLFEKLKLEKGVVSIFGLLNNKDNIVILFDEDIINDLPLTFHPNENDATIFINSEDVIKFLNTLNVSYKIITI